MHLFYLLNFRKKNILIKENNINTKYNKSYNKKKLKMYKYFKKN